MPDFSVFTTAEAWVSLAALVFLEIVLGVDNIVFITITTNRLNQAQQALGRKLGLLGALVSRIAFLSFASMLVHLTDPLLNLSIGPFNHGFSIRDIVLCLGGAYLLYKAIGELAELKGSQPESGTQQSAAAPLGRTISLPRAIATIMVMDVVFSIDSVVTAVGMAQHLIVMIIAVMAAVMLMMLFIDQISTFINAHIEMKVLALVFIGMIGVLLLFDGAGISTGIEAAGMHAEKLAVYALMAISLVMVLLHIRSKGNGS